MASSTESFTDHDFRDAMANWSSGIAVVTAEHQGRRVGMVCNSVSSVSLNSALVSWCVDRNSSSFGIWEEADTWALHILAQDQQTLVQRYAQRGSDKCHDLETVKGATNSPLISGCASVIECKSWHKYDGGDHVIMVGQVFALSTNAILPLRPRPRLVPVRGPLNESETS